MKDPGIPETHLLARWDHAKWLQDRLGEARAENAALEAECERLRAAFQTYLGATTFRSSLPLDTGHPNAPSREAWVAARAALGEADDE